MSREIQDRHEDLWNDDLAPTQSKDHTWRWYHFASLWIGIGMVMCVPAYTLAAD